MKNFMFAVVFVVFALCSLPACTKDDLSNIELKTDGSMKTTFGTGSSGFGAGSRARTGISF